MSTELHEKLTQLSLKAFKATEQKNKLLEHYKEAVDASTIFSIADPHGVIKYANEQFCKISGYTLEELVGQPHSIVRHPDMPKEAFADMWKTIKSGRVWKGVVKNSAKDGSLYVVDATIVPSFDDNGEIFEYIGIRHDITKQYIEASELKQSVQAQENVIEYLRHIDNVTGLKNQAAFISFLNEHDGEEFTIIGIKIDNLKVIKDIIGWEYTDEYIIKFTETLSSYVAKNEDLAGLFRVYFDEILIVLKGINPQFANLAKELFHFSKYFIVEHNDITITSPLTMVMLAESKELYQKTLSALLYTFEHYRGELYILEDTKVIESNKMTNNIDWFRKYCMAIENEKITPFYQPILNNHTGKVEKFECLARIYDEDGEIISPANFVELAQSAKQISFLTRTIIKRAFNFFSDKPQFEFSINFSYSDLQDEELIKQLIFWQEKTQTDPSRVVLEILESEEIYKFQVFKRAIESLKNIGFKIAIDDFGTGYSNFISLYDYKVDFIKIDGSFIKNLDTDSSMYEMVMTLRQLISMVGAKSIAEYVSNEKILSIVKEIGIDYSQGYHIGAPKKDISDFEA